MQKQVIVSEVLSTGFIKLSTETDELSTVLSAIMEILLQGREGV
jgi:hypothetical protein